MLASVLTNLGANVLYAVQRVGMLSLFLVTVLSRAVTPPIRLRPILKQVHFIGAKSWLVIVVSGTFVGMVVALQFYDTLVRFGSVSLLGSAVGLSLIRELGPVLTALMVIGRAGSAICAEVGIMRSEDQIDALECMSIDPYRYLIAPKFVATIVSVPLLTAMFDVVGIMGGYAVGVAMFGISTGAYFEGMAETILVNDVAMGVVKSFVFGLIIIWVSSGKGFFLHRERHGAFGAEGVSRVTTSAVVMSSISVLFMDYLISTVML
jgi:phospholipid/cholesterol/gamma-HCH transport system permease protein